MPEVLPSIKRISTKNADLKVPKVIILSANQNSSFSSANHEDRIDKKRVVFNSTHDKKSKGSKNSQKSFDYHQDTSVDSNENISSDLPGFRKIKPVRMRLTAQEQHKIFSCYDEVITNLEIITSVVIFLFNKKNVVLYEQLKTEVGDHMNDNLVKLKKYCEQVDHSYLNNPNSDDPYFDWFEVKVSEKCRSLTRMLEFNDKCREKILAYLPEKVSYGTLGRKLYQPKKMIKAFKDLREILYERFLTTPVEKIRQLKFINDVCKSNLIYQESCEKLQKELEEVTMNKMRCVIDQDGLILKLKGSIHEVSEFHKQQIDGLNKECAKQKKTDFKAHLIEITKLNEKLKHKKQTLETTTEINRTNEKKMKKRNYQIQSEIEGVIDKYDEEMGYFQRKINEISKEYTVEKQQLEEIEKSFNDVCIKYKEVQDRNEREKQEKEAEELKMIKRHDAIVSIQAYFRAYLVKKRVKNAQIKHLKELKKAKRKERMRRKMLKQQKKFK